MIVPLLVLAMAGAQPLPGPAPASKCPEVATPEALVCRALEAESQGQPALAAQAFEQAANASPEGDPALSRLFAAAGNMWIAAGDPVKAAIALDRALRSPGLDGQQRGQALLDRARAAEAQGDLKAARATLNEAVKTIGADPFYWFFSAGLAVREGNYTAAETAIDKALNLAPNDPSLLFEAGHIAELNGDTVGARAYWNRTIQADPKGATGRAAREALNLLPVPLTVKN